MSIVMSRAKITLAAIAASLTVAATATPSAHAGHGIPQRPDAATLGTSSTDLPPGPGAHATIIAI